MSETGSGRRWWWIALLGAGLGLVIAAGLLRPAYRQHKEQRSLRQAQAFIASGDLRSALLSLRQTLLLNPTNLTAMKLLADFATQTQSPAALGWWQKIATSFPTTENQMLLAAAALRLEPPPFPVAAETIAALAQAGATNLPYHLLASQLALKLDQGQIAEAHLLAAQQLEPTNRMHQVNLAALRLHAQKPEVAEAARTQLGALIPDPIWGPTVLRALIGDALLQSNGPAALGLSEKLLATTNTTFADRLQFLTAAALARSANMPAILQQEQERCGTNLLQITQLAVWQNQSGHSPATLNWLSRLAAEKREVPPVALLTAEALVRTQNWPGLEGQLHGQRWEDQEFLRLAYLARALREQGRTTIATANWERAVGAAAGRAERIGALTQMAFNWGWREEGIEALWQSARYWEREAWPIQNLTRLYTAANDTEGLFRVYSLITAREPDNLPAKNNLIMLGLLLQRDLAPLAQQAEALNTVAGTNGIFASTYALALHLNGRSAAGLTVLLQLPAAEQNRPEVRPYRALLQAATGQKSQVRAELLQAAAAAKLPEEKLLFTVAAAD
jgi:hypothetical protein